MHKFGNETQAQSLHYIIIINKGNNADREIEFCNE